MSGGIFLIDYGFGNLHSIEKAMHFIGVDITITDEPDELEEADGIILPGVGAYGEAMEELKRRHLLEPLSKFVENGKPFLGICLGMQLLFSYSEEFGYHEGLDFIDGMVVHLDSEKLLDRRFQYKIPQIGWNRLFASDKKNDWKGTILDGVDEGSEVYFVHSFVAVPKDRSIILSYTNYGGVLFAAAIQKSNIYGCQFHPEKSRDVGIRILQNFNAICQRFRNERINR